MKGAPTCKSNRGFRPGAIVATVLKVVEPGAVAAAIAAEAEVSRHAIRSAKHSDAISLDIITAVRHLVLIADDDWQVPRLFGRGESCA
jgi:hypothetical protein